MKQNDLLLPAEWYPQSAICITWPHADTDWADMLPEVEACYVNLATAIVRYEPLVVITPEPDHVAELLAPTANGRVHYFKCSTNDTWTRDHGFITTLCGGEAQLMDFCFNGWGMKFAANYDNLINSKLYAQGVVHGRYVNHRDFVLEGGSIESDGAGTLLTTATCLCSPNRNDTLTIADIEQQLRLRFGVQQVLWLHHGYLAGDDTDSHVDTLARLCPNHTIAYVQCTHQQDEHYMALQRMEQELQAFRTLAGEPYRLLPLPMADPIVVDGERLPATYANFLIINGAVLYPTYNQPANDAKAAAVLQQAFPERAVIGIDCRALIKQHGSLHCATMQLPKEVTL